MLKRTLFVITVFIFISTRLFAQQYYLASSGETIFSVGTVSAGDADIWPVLRFSPVFNFQGQIHYDLSKSFGIYTGLGIRNVGLISKVEYFYSESPGGTLQKTVTIKERAYGLGLPLMFKLGDMDDKVYFSAGAEAEVMFAYKRKIIEEDTKNKTSRWFDDRVNIFNPSVLAEVHFPKGHYLRFKYYLMDFLNYRGITLIDGTNLPDYGEKSPLFYIAFGTVHLNKKEKDNVEVESTQTAYFNEKKHNAD